MMGVLTPTSSQMTFLKASSPEIWNQCGYFFFASQYPCNRIAEALNIVIEKSDALRMRFVNGRPKIIDYHPIKVSSYCVDNEEAFRELLQEEIKRNLTRNEYLFYPSIVSVCDRTGVVFVFHHVIADGYSFNSLQKKIVDILHGRDIPYDSFVPQMVHEASYRSSYKYQQDIGLWNQRLAQLPQLNCFEAEAGSADQKCIIFQDDEIERLECFCRKTGFSESEALCGAVVAYLHCVSGFDRFTVGLPIINRSRKSQYNSIGLYMHIIPIIASVTDDDNLSEVLAMVREEIYSVFRHPNFTTYDIQKECLGGRLAHSNLFDVTVEYSTLEDLNGIEPNLFYGDYLPVSMEIHFIRHGSTLKLIARCRKGVSAAGLGELATHAFNDPSIKVRELRTLVSAPIVFSTGKSVAIPNKSLYHLINEWTEN